MPDFSTLPLYRCHKEVRAFKIAKIILDPKRGYLILADHPTLGSIWADDAWIAKTGAVAGGYYVVYSDGYVSYSPAKAFEEGYTQIEAPKPVPTPKTETERLQEEMVELRAQIQRLSIAKNTPTPRLTTEETIFYDPPVVDDLDPSDLQGVKW
jgi:hypothetical protein